MKLSTRIKEFRESKGMSREAFAEQLETRPVTIMRWENGSSKPKPEIAEKLKKMGIGEIGVEETKANSTPRIVNGNTSELRQSVTSKFKIQNDSYDFEPSPYVINGPTDQIQFFEELYALQAKACSSIEKNQLMRRLSAAASIEEIQTAQHQLESPSKTAKHWNTNYGSHGWHRYVGRFPPQLVRALINYFGLKSGDVVCDPFLGSGTTLVEARLLGLKGLGIEICPLSSLISRTKSQFPESTNNLKKLQIQFEKDYKKIWNDFVGIRNADEIDYAEIMERRGNNIPKFSNCNKWFCPSALLGTSIAVELIEKMKGYERDFFATALSAKMRSIGNLDVDVIRAEYSKKPRKNVDVLNLVSKQLSKMITAIGKMVSTHRDLLSNTDDIDVREGSVLSEPIKPGSVSCIITSPPYGVEALSYLRTHLLSYRSLFCVLGHDPYATHNDVIGSEYLEKNNSDKEILSVCRKSETFNKFFDKSNEEIWAKKLETRTLMMAQFFAQMHDIGEKFFTWLKPEGGVAFVVGNKKLGDSVVPTAEIIKELFGVHGLELVHEINHKLKCNNTNSEVPWQERIIQEEAILIFKKAKNA